MSIPVSLVSLSLGDGIKSVIDGAGASGGGGACSVRTTGIVCGEAIGASRVAEGACEGFSTVSALQAVGASKAAVTAPAPIIRAAQRGMYLLSLAPTNSRDICEVIIQLALVL